MTNRFDSDQLKKPTSGSTIFARAGHFLVQQEFRVFSVDRSKAVFPLQFLLVSTVYY